MNLYDTNITELTCSCKDWEEVRSGYSIDDPRRLCKHIINKLDVNNLPNDLKYFKEDLAFYKENEKGFNKQFQKIIPLLDSKYLALYNDDDWTNIYHEDGENFALIITSFNNDFKWAKDKKPKEFQEIEIYFDKDEYLPAIELFGDERALIFEKLKERYGNVKFDDSMNFVSTANSVSYMLTNEKDEEFYVEATNETITITPYITDTIVRNQEKVHEALAKRKEERKKTNWYLEEYKKRKSENFKEDNSEFEMLSYEETKDKAYDFKNDWEHKLKQNYESAVVDKGLMLKFESFKLPRFVSEYIVSNFIDQHGIKEGLVKVEEFLSKHYPKPNSTDLLHYRIQTEGSISIIDNFKVSVHIERHGNEHSLSIPALNIKHAKIEDHQIIYDNPRLLNSGLWGMGRITRTDDATKAVLSKFKPFQVSSIDLNVYKEKRGHFSTHEWLNILISTIGFNPKIFTTPRAKLIILSRLLPLIQKSIFLFEFGKPGTGKTYIFDKLSNSSFVISGSKITPAKLFKDCSSNQEGLLRQYEAILFDEIDKINDSDFADEIVNKLLKFMESNSFDRCGEEMMSDTSLIFSGNISRVQRDGDIPNFFAPLAPKLKGEAFLDRFGGVIPGWEIQPLSNVNGNFSTTQGFSADYFSAIMSELRLEEVEARVSSMLEFSQNTSNRDEKAIIKNISGFFKLIFPDMKIDADVAQEVVNFCVELRQYIINERFELYGNGEDERKLEVRLVV